MNDSVHTLDSALRTTVWQSIRRQSDGSYVLADRNPETLVQALIASAANCDLECSYDRAGHEYAESVMRELSAALTASGLAWLQSGVVGDPGRIVPMAEAETVKAAEEAVINRFRSQLGIGPAVSGDPW